MLLQVKNLSKSYKHVQAVKDVSLELNQGEILCIIGPSGSGKSTLLKLINQLESPDRGDCFIDGISTHTSNKEIRQKTLQKIGFIFQDFALFDHLTIRQNIELAPRIVYKKNINDTKRITLELLDMVGLLDKIDDYPITLSGGQKQRIAIARALATSPSLLLFDEPTSALDVGSVNDLILMIKELQNKNIGILIVTHDLKFAKAVSNRLLFMKDSSIIFNKDINDVSDLDLIFES